LAVIVTVLLSPSVVSFLVASKGLVSGVGVGGIGVGAKVGAGVLVGSGVVVLKGVMVGVAD